MSGVEHVLVAVGHFNGDGTWSDAVIIAWTIGGKLAPDIEALTADDILATRDGDTCSDPVPRSVGLWLWEGVPEMDEESDGLPDNETQDAYLMTGGIWRRPTIADLVTLGVVDGDPMTALRVALAEAEATIARLSSAPTAESENARIVKQIRHVAAIHAEEAGPATEASRVKRALAHELTVAAMLLEMVPPPPTARDAMREIDHVTAPDRGERGSG